MRRSRRLNARLRRYAGVAVSLAFGLAAAASAQDEMGDLPRAVLRGEAPEAALSVESPGELPPQARNLKPGLTSLESLGLPPDARERAARRLPPAALRRTGPPVEKDRTARSTGPGIAPLASAFALAPTDSQSEAVPYDEWQAALQAAGLIRALVDGPETESDARLEELASEVEAALSSASRGRQEPELTAIWRAVRDGIEKLRAARWQAKGILDVERYKLQYARWRARQELTNSLPKLEAAIRAARSSPAAMASAARAMLTPATLRFPASIAAVPGQGALPTLTLKSPSGKSSKVRAFPDSGEFAVRVMADEPGVWTVTAPGGASASARLTEKGSRKVRVDRAFPRVFTRQDGSLFVPVGQNLCWVLDGNSFDERVAGWRAYLDRLAGSGQNWFRVWCCPWSLALETKAGGAGRYDETNARMLDRLLEMAAERGIYLQLVLEYHGMLVPADDWSNNPYNAVNGGPCKQPGDFFANAEARRLFKRRLDYLVARYGAYENLFAWELFNEADLTGMLSYLNMAKWHREMAAYLKAIDPWQHMVSTSTAGRTLVNAVLWTIPEIDYTQLHIYERELPTEMAAAIGTLRLFAKPVLCGEAGHDARGPEWEQRNDPKGVGLHRALLTGMFSGGAGSAMFWWWDNYIKPADLYSVFEPVGRIARLFDSPSGLTPVDAAVSGPAAGSVRARAVGWPGRVLVWLDDTSYKVTEGSGPPAPSRRAPMKLRVRALGTKRQWAARAVDVWTASESDAGTARFGGSSLELQSPAFERGVVLVLTEK